MPCAGRPRPRPRTRAARNLFDSVSNHPQNLLFRRVPHERLVTEPDTPVASNNTPRKLLACVLHAAAHIAADDGLEISWMWLPFLAVKALFVRVGPQAKLRMLGVLPEVTQRGCNGSLAVALAQKPWDAL